MKDKELKERSRKYFNSVAENQEIIAEPARCYDIVMDVLEKQGSFSALADISCGTGEMLRRLANQYGNAVNLYGVDLSERSIAQAKAKLGDSANLRTGDVDDLPLEDACMDVVLNMHSFHHYPDPVHALEEIRRILKDDGTFFLVENNYTGLRRIFINLRIAGIRHFQGDVKMYSEKQLESMLGEADFQVVESRKIADHSILMICRRG